MSALGRKRTLLGIVSALVSLSWSGRKRTGARGRVEGRRYADEKRREQA